MHTQNHALQLPTEASPLRVRSRRNSLPASHANSAGGLCCLRLLPAFGATGRVRAPHRLWFLLLLGSILTGHAQSHFCSIWIFRCCSHEIRHVDSPRKLHTNDRSNRAANPQQCQYTILWSLKAGKGEFILH